MARFSLGCYSVRLRDKDSHENLRLDSIGGSKNLLNLFSNYLEERESGYAVNGGSQRVLLVRRFMVEGSLAKGIIETGEYGYEAELRDVQTADVTYQRTANDAEMMPFYFLAYLPHNLDEGILILQRRAQYGIRTVLGKDFADYFRRIQSGIVVDVNPLLPDQLINEFLQYGRITKIRFVRFTIPSDLTDAFEGGGHVEDLGQAELVISAGRNRRLPLVGRVRDVIGGNRNVKNMIELTNFDYDNVKVELDVGGSRRTVDLSNTFKLRAHYDITSELEIGPNGHPKFASIDSIATELLQDLRKTLGTGGRDVG